MFIMGTDVWLKFYCECNPTDARASGRSTRRDLPSRRGPSLSAGEEVAALRGAKGVPRKGV